MIAHACTFTIIDIIVAALLFGGMMFWYVKTRKEGTMTPIEEKAFSKVFKKKAAEGEQK